MNSVGDQSIDTVQIRAAAAGDTAVIGRLLANLGYPDTAEFLETRVLALRAHPDSRLLVAARRDAAVVGCIALHFIPQLAVLGDFCRIAYLCVDPAAQGRGIGRALEAAAVALAIERGCDRIEVHCASRRTQAHRFYDGRGYVESPKYLVKAATHRSARRGVDAHGGNSLCGAGSNGQSPCEADFCSHASTAGSRSLATIVR